MNVPQPGGTLKNLDTIDSRIMSGVMRNGRIWTAHNVLNAGGTGATVAWYEIASNGWTGTGTPPSFVQEQRIVPAGIGGLSDDNIWMSHINVDAYNNMALVFSICGPSRFASIAYSGRVSTDAAGTVRPLVIAKAGTANYEQLDGISRNRWGDYAGLALDPDGVTFWTFHEWAGLPLLTPFPGTGGNWFTNVTCFRVQDENVPPPTGPAMIAPAARAIVSSRDAVPRDPGDRPVSTVPMFIDS